MILNREITGTIVNQKIPLLTKVYVWSVIFESFLFFSIGDQQSTGFNINFGKTLQLCSFSLLIFQWLTSKRDFLVVNLSHPKYKYFTVYFLLTVLAAVVGGLMGSYTLKNQYNSEYASTFIAKIVRSSSFRPILEYIILGYYFLYFIVLPRYLFKGKNELSYFFKCFLRAFVFCMILGYLDLALQLVGISILPRDIWERILVGFRFHGVAGEPRDAFVYVFFAFCILNLKSFWESREFVSQKFTFFILFTMLLTQSASGLSGLIVGGLLILIHLLRKVSVKKLIVAFSLFILVALIVFIGIYSSSRIQDYIDAFYLVYESLQNEIPPPAIYLGQMNNIYPLWDLFSKFLKGNFIPLFLGSGFGSSSVANNNLGNGLWDELTNPHSQLVRLFYDCGIIGTFYFIKMFVYPVKYLTTLYTKSEQQRFIITTMALLGLNLSHRSTTIYIFLGIFLVVFEQLKNQHNFINEK